MINVLFIDYMTLMNNDHEILALPNAALRDIIEKIDDIRIVCLNTKEEQNAFHYDILIDFLSQEFSLKKSLFFDKIDIEDWNDRNKIVSDISSWMKNKEVKSFAIVASNGKVNFDDAYPNNVTYCNDGHFTYKYSEEVIWIMSNYKNTIAKDSNMFFVSDTHFGHVNIIKYCNRPWNSGKDENGDMIITNEDVLAMDNEMIKRWNSVVGKNDIIWHLGDFALGGKDTAERVFPQLNGKINLVMGNHDHWKMKWYYDLGFNRVYDRKVIINDFVILTHAPLMFLNENCPFYQIFGHVHSSNAYYTWTKNSCCVCVERHNYYPISWKTIKEKYDMLNKRQ